MNIDLDKIVKASGVYIIKCLPNKRLYIGSAKNLYTKFKKYEKELKNANYRVQELNEDIINYGIDNIELEVLCICDYSIATLVERYYIKRYDAIGLGYNKINASKNIRKPIYTYKLENEYGLSEYYIALMMKKLMLEMFDFSNFSFKECVLISVQNLLDIYDNECRGQFEDKIRYWLFEIFSRLDLTTFIRDYETGNYYEVSGNQMGNYIRWNDFKTDNKIDEQIKDRLCGRCRYFNTMYVEFPKYIGSDKDIEAMILNIDEFRKNNNIIDATYKQQYKKQEERYTAHYILQS